MNLRLRCLALAVAVCMVQTIAAQQIYKCTNSQGDIAFQDRHCATGEKQVLVEIVGSTPSPATEPITEAVPTQPAPPIQTAQPPIAPPPRPALPPLWLCTRPEDGSRYVSHDGATPSRLVPMGILGYPSKSLASVYSAGGSGGVSAPEISKPTTAHDAIANNYTEVHDECVPASAEQTCDYLRSELDTVEKKLRNAFKDDRAALEPRQAKLREDLAGC